MIIFLTIALVTSIVFNIYFMIEKWKSKEKEEQVYIPPITPITYKPDRLMFKRIYTREELYRLNPDMMEQESLVKMLLKEEAKHELMDKVIEYASIHFEKDYFRQQVEATAEIKVLRPGEQP